MNLKASVHPSGPSIKSIHSVTQSAVDNVIKIPNINIFIYIGRLFPCYVEYSDNKSNTVQFQYQSNIVRQMFLAQSSSTKLLVKFVEEYSEEAHGKIIFNYVRCSAVQVCFML